MFEQVLSNDALPNYISALLVMLFVLGGVLIMFGLGAALLSPFFLSADYINRQAWNTACIGGGMAMPLFLPLFMPIFAGEVVEVVEMSFMLKLSILGGAVVVVLAACQQFVLSGTSVPARFHNRGKWSTNYSERHFKMV